MDGKNIQSDNNFYGKKAWNYHFFLVFSLNQGDDNEFTANELKNIITLEYIV